MATKTMKAAFLREHGGLDALSYGELPEPGPPGLGEITVKIHYAALNHLDVWVRRGLAGLKLSFPHALCGDGAGTVVACGAQVTRFKVGDEVVIHPGLSCGACESCLSGWESLCPSYRILGEHTGGTSVEKINVPEANVFLKPPTLSFEEAAALPLVYTTAWQMALHRGKIGPGSTALIHAAASGVSSAAIQIAKLVGATVIATAGSEEKVALAKKLGADHAINYKSQDFLAEVKQLTSRRGVDVILDHVGKEIWEKNVKAVRWGGTIVLCGASSGFDVGIDLRQVFYRQIAILGSTMGSKADFPTILRLAGAGKLRPVVGQVLPLSDIRRAQELLEARQVLGKVLLKID